MGAAWHDLVVWWKNKYAQRERKTGKVSPVPVELVCRRPLVVIAVVTEKQQLVAAR